MDTIHALFRPLYHARLHACILLAFMALLIAVISPLPAHAVDYEGWDGKSEMSLEEAKERADIKDEHFKALGLSFDQGILEDMQAPFPENRATELMVQREVYVAANGNNDNVYTVRDGLDKLETSHDNKDSVKKYTDVYDGWGQLYGGYDFYGLSKKTPSSKKGGSYESYLASNAPKKPRGGLLTSANTGFTGKYADSVAYSASKGGDAKSDHLAELIAYGNTHWVSVGGTHYDGGIHIVLYSLDDRGKRTEVGRLYPTVNESQVYSYGDPVNNEFKYLDAGYIQEYESYFELQRGDVDGDGYDELFAYAGAYRDSDGRRLAIVDMFKTANGADYKKTSVEIDAGKASDFVSVEQLKKDNPDKKNHDGVSDFWHWQILKTAPVVTIATGDLDRNGTDEVAISVSAPSSHNNVAGVASCHIFNWDGAVLKSAAIGEGGKGVIPLAVDDKAVATAGVAKGTAMVSANCTFGAFQVPDGGYYTTALVISGYMSTTTTTRPTDAYSKFGYRYVYYDMKDNVIKVSEFRTHSLGHDGQRIADMMVHHCTKTRHYMPTPAPIALGAARLEALDTSANMSDHLLIAGDIYEMNILTGLAAKEMGSISLTLKQCNQNGHDKNKDQIWIGRVVSGIVSDNMLANESFLAVIGVHRDEELRGSDDYYWFDVAHFTFENGKASTKSTGQEGVVCESNRASKKKYGTWVSLCLPDIDDDGMRIRFVGKELIVSSPEVLAVLQDSPTFKDLDEVYGYVADGETSFGKDKSHAASNGFYIDGAAGAYGEAELSLFVTAKLQGSLQIAGSFDYLHTRNKTYGISYASKGGKGNKAVVYSVPSVYYRYEYYDPEKGAWIGYTMPMKSDPVTSVVSVEAWNEVVSTTTSLKPITTEVISNISGHPETYPNSLGGDNKLRGKDYDTTTTVTKSEGASTTRYIDDEGQNDFNFSIGLSACVTYAMGVGFLGNNTYVGPVVNADLGYQHSEIWANGAHFSATVDNLPLLDNLANNAGGYGFSWRLMVNSLGKQKEHDKPLRVENVFLIGYDVKDVIPPSLSMVADAHVSKATDRSITLRWIASDFGTGIAAENSAYAIGMLSSSSDDVATWRYVESDKTEYTWGNLSPSKSYRFVVRAMHGGWNGDVFNPTSSSISTTPINGSTLEQGESCTLGPLRTIQPTGSAVKAGESAIYEAEASWIQPDENGNPADRSKDVYYLWQVKRPGENEWLSVAQGYGTQELFYDLSLGKVVKEAPEAANAGIPDMSPNLVAAPDPPAGTGLGQDAGEGPTPSVSRLTATGASEDNDGTLFRCQVGFNDQRLITNTVELKVQGSEPAQVNSPEQPEEIGPSLDPSALYFVGNDGGIVDGEHQEQDDNGDDNDDGDDKKNQGNNQRQNNGNNQGGQQSVVKKTVADNTAKTVAGKTAAKTSDATGAWVPLLVAALILGGAFLVLATRLARRT